MISFQKSSHHSFNSAVSKKERKSDQARFSHQSVSEKTANSQQVISQQKMKPVSQRIPDSTFLPKDSNDPLVHTTQDLFWYYVEPYFNPVAAEDFNFLQNVSADSSASNVDNDSNSKRRKDPPSVLQRLQEFPLSQRLTAALLDDGKGDALAAKPVRSGIGAEDIWIGGTLSASKEVNQLVEDRIRDELDRLGLLDNETKSQVHTESRMEQWHLQNLVATNQTMKGELLKTVINDLQTQGGRREKKQRENEAEIKYLESLIEKGGKRGKGKFTKILNQMHPNRHMMVGEPLNTAQKTSGAGVEKGVSKKRRRKSTANEVPRKSVEHSSANNLDSTDLIAHHVAEIIWKHNNQALLDDIVKEFVEKVPQLAGNIKDARKKITTCITSSKKSFKFRKLQGGIAYSCERVRIDRE